MGGVGPILKTSAVRLLFSPSDRTLPLPMYVHEFDLPLYSPPQQVEYVHIEEALHLLNIQ